MSNGSVANTIKRGLSAIAEGEVFNYTRFPINKDNDQAVVKALSRLVKKGEIVRVEKGKYYKPRQTRFGVLRPGENEIIKTVTVKGNQQVGYLTGIALYNRLGLTTQVSNVLVIARNGRLPIKEINGYKVRFVIRSMKFTQKDIPLLQLLDAIRDIKDIPDTTVDKSVSVLVKKLKTLGEGELKKIVKLSMRYNPATRALLGAILEYYFSDVNILELSKSLNQLSKYKIGVSGEVLPNRTKWNIE